MLDFVYNTPTKVFFGKNAQSDVGGIIKSYGFKKIMLQYGKSSIKKNGLYDIIMSSLNKNGIEVVEMGGVEPNPKVSFVRRAVKLAKESGVELVLAVGGGSVIDSSKATAIGAMHDCDIWDIFMGKVKPTAALPVGCVLTLAAAGSEMSASAVLTNTDCDMKKGLGSELNRCLFAVCNPELTYTVNKYTTACGIVDIMSHTMERYFTVCDPTDLTDRISEGLLKSVIEAGKRVMEEPDNYEARATLMWASSLSHNGLTGCGRENALAVHQLEHALSGKYDSVAHGAGLAVLFPAWGRYIYKYNIQRFSQFARRVFDVAATDDEEAARLGVEKMAEYFASLGMPTTLSELGVKADESETLAKLCTYNSTRTVKSYIPLGDKEVKEIFELCY